MVFSVPDAEKYGYCSNSIHYTCSLGDIYRNTLTQHDFSMVLHSSLGGVTLAPAMRSTSSLVKG